jgi:cytochrome c-type biogenesis protein CcmH
MRLAPCDNAAWLQLASAALCLARNDGFFNMVIFWLLATLLCVVPVLALWLLPGRQPDSPASREQGALAIYKNQLRDLERDVASGLLDASEAGAQQTEISRRLLQAHNTQAGPQALGAGVPRLALLAIPVLAVAVYGFLGQPNVPDVPRAQRLAAAETNNDWEALIARVEMHLDKNPDDLQGWQLLATNYMGFSRYGDAARAYANIIRLSPPKADLFSAMAEALVFENKGLLTAQSLSLFAEALKLDARNDRARYYQALGLAQEGKVELAKTAFSALLASAPADAPWKQTVERELAKLNGSASAPQLSPQQMQDAENMTPADRQAMILSMVEGLDQKLKTNPQDLEGWLRLIRARSVLQDMEKTNAALAAARATFNADAAKLQQVNALAQELNLK